MKKPAILSTFGFLFFSPLLCFAVSIVECEDKEGNRSFQRSCPPGHTELDRKDFYIQGEPHHIPAVIHKAQKSATLYMIPECDTCDEVKEFLENNGVSVSEIDVSGDYETQTEFAALAGELKVPVTVIDGRLIRGYSRAEFRTALEAGPSEPDSGSGNNGGDQAPAFEAPDIR